MAGKEIKINDKTYGENTKITLTAKNLIWIISLLITGICTLATIGYFDIKSRVSDLDKNYEQKVEASIDEIMSEDREKREEIIKTIGEMKGDIKVILDRTSHSNTHNNTGNVTYIPNNLNTPSNLPNSSNINRVTDTNTSVYNLIEN